MPNISDESEIVRIALLEEQLKVANHRIGDLEAITKNICDINYTNQQMLEQMKQMNENMKKTNERIDKIEREPVEEYKAIKNKVRDTVITVLATSFVTGCLAVVAYFIKLK